MEPVQKSFRPCPSLLSAFRRRVSPVLPALRSLLTVRFLGVHPITFLAAAEKSLFSEM